jgi:hypothetical protein
MGERSGAPSGFSLASIVISKPPVAVQLPQQVSANRDAPHDLRLDTWPHQPALQKHSKTLANGEGRRASSSIGRECRGQEKRVLQDSEPKRLKRLGRSPKLPEGKLHDFPVDGGSISVASKRMPVDFFGREERAHARSSSGVAMTTSSISDLRREQRVRPTDHGNFPILPQ